eukprot:scaffold1441_cov120-Isochrysis_galbana.AAC.19
MAMTHSMTMTQIQICECVIMRNAWGSTPAAIMSAQAAPLHRVDGLDGSLIGGMVSLTWPRGKH